MKCPSCGYDNPSNARTCEICDYPLGATGSLDETRVQTEQSTPGDLQDGEVLDGRYLVVKRLGHGGMGEVYLVQDQKMGRREIALKLSSFNSSNRILILDTSLADPHSGPGKCWHLLLTAGAVEKTTHAERGNDKGSPFPRRVSEKAW